MENNIPARIYNFIKSEKYISFKDKEGKDKNIKDLALVNNVKVEPRIRKDDLTQALSMKVYDPLWMLSRQWQMGEFRGNNAGTAVSVKCEVEQQDCSTNPIEPITEQVNPAIDLLVRVESAMHYIEMIKKVGNPTGFLDIIKELQKKYPIDWSGTGSRILDCNATKDAEDNLNTQRISFAKAFQNKAFDGYKLYLDMKDKQNNDNFIGKPYVDWFKKQYLPADQNNSHWNEQALNYTIDIKAGSRHFIGDRYQGGRLSWYTVDDNGRVNSNTKPESETIASLPTLARYPGAPNKRLWQFEDHAVFMGNSTEQQTKANEMFLKFATLYSNDWMLIPLKTAIGKYITIKSIEVKDTFGVLHTIKRRASAEDTKSNNLQENWQMFTNSKYGTFDGSAEDGLFFAPQLAATIESKPIEEVELLRDEMANMVWGVEKTVSDGCGFTLDEQLKAVQLKTVVDELENSKKPEPGKVSLSENSGPERMTSTESDYRYTLQTHVPFNWIPFIPEQIKGKQQDYGNHFDLWGREMILRRGKMPCHILTKNGYERYAVLPISSILRKGLDGNKYMPLFINEEEVQQTGIRLIKNYQRTRWLNGKTYVWLGMYKRLAKFSENSGLEFDTLHKKQ